jgi:hypothetical protein
MSFCSENGNSTQLEQHSYATKKYQVVFDQWYATSRAKVGNGRRIIPQHPDQRYSFREPTGKLDEYRNEEYPLVR